MIGVYAALVARELYYGRTPILWGVLWRVETDWLPFLTLITVLVFSQAGLYEERGRRPGFGRILSSLLLVALITLAFAIGTGHNFSTYGLAPTAVLLCAVVIAALRSSYDFVTGEVLRAARRSPPRAARRLGREPGAPARRARLHPQRDRLRVRRRGRPVVRGDRPAGSRRRAGPARDPRDRARGRADRDRLRLQRPRAARDRLARPPQGRPGADRAEGHRAADPAGRVRAGAGRAAVRAAPACVRGHRLVRQAGLRPRRLRAGAAGGPAALARDRRGAQADLARPGVLPRPPHRPRRAGVRDAQVPHDVRGRGRASRPSSRPPTKPTGRCSRSARTRG